MRKLIMLFAGLAMTIMASAQNYEWTGPFGMPYVNVNGGAVSVMKVDNFNDFVKGVHPMAGLELGTYFTPVWGASVEGLAFLGTTGSYTFVDQSSVLANGKVNLSNLFAGYKGQPYRVEVVGVGGLGWGHDYGEPKIDPNYVVYNTGAEVNFNLGKERAWQISVRPGVLWNNYDNHPKFEYKDAVARLALGVTYKFGNRKIKSHNFVTNTYDAYKRDYKALSDKYNDLLNREPEVVVKEVPVEKKVVVTETRIITGGNIITFPIGSCELSATEKAKVEQFAKNLDEDTLVHLLGSADSQTGSEPRNFALAKNRVNVVKNALLGFGVPEDRIETDSTLDATDNVLTSRSVVVSLSVK